MSVSMCVYVYMCAYMCVYVYIYIYIERERGTIHVQYYTCMYVYIYIYTYNITLCKLSRRRTAHYHYVI